MQCPSCQIIRFGAHYQLKGRSGTARHLHAPFSVQRQKIVILSNGRPRRNVPSEFGSSESLLQNPSVERVFLLKISNFRMPGLAMEPPPWYEQGFQTTTYRGDGSMTLHQSMADAWKRFQDELFPSLREQVGHLGKRHQRLVAILDLAPIEGFLPGRWRGTGRRPQDRRAIARAFIAKAGAEPADRARPAGPAAVRPGAAPAVRPAPSRRDPERGDLLECVRRVRRGRAARAPARVAGDDRLCRCACRPHLPRLDRHLRAGEAGAEAEAGEKPKRRRGARAGARRSSRSRAGWSGSRAGRRRATSASRRTRRAARSHGPGSS